jgi:hypothetical protein
MITFYVGKVKDIIYFLVKGQEIVTRVECPALILCSTEGEGRDGEHKVMEDAECIRVIERQKKLGGLSRQKNSRSSFIRGFFVFGPVPDALKDFPKKGVKSSPSGALGKMSPIFGPRPFPKDDLPALAGRCRKSLKNRP